MRSTQHHPTFAGVAQQQDSSKSLNNPAAGFLAELQRGHERRLQKWHCGEYNEEDIFAPVAKIIEEAVRKVRPFCRVCIAAKSIRGRCSSLCKRFSISVLMNQSL